MRNSPFPRMRRVNSIIWEVLADEVHLLADPRLVAVTITGVDTSPDLRRAIVFYSCGDLQLLEEVGEGLNSAAGRLQGRLASQVRLKYTPKLDFRPDQGIIGGQKIEKLLRGDPSAAPVGEQ